ncbi:MAG: HAMP domain-containing sensor histidine kinase [Acidobacteriota bacterium]
MPEASMIEPVRDRRYPKLSIRGPVTLFVIVLVLIITLTVLWNVVLVQDYQKLRAVAEETIVHWAYIALGSVLFIAIIVLSSILSAQLIAQIRWSQQQSRFIASVSHELNSPLSSIKLFAQTLRQSDLADSARLDFVDKILFDVRRLQRLIANILRAAEMDHRADELQVVTQAVDLRRTLEDFVADSATLYPNATLRFEHDLDRPLPVALDPLMFRQVLDNLVDNAVRYRGDAPADVTIRLKVDDDEALLELEDRGIGILPDALPRLFDRFYRAEEESPSRRQKGTGIGLFVVRSIIQAHGGKVSAHSDGIDRGATLSIRLPALPATALERIRSRRSRAAGPHPVLEATGAER